MLDFDVPALNDSLNERLQQKIDTKTKPLGALGQLEGLAYQIAKIQNTLHPTLEKPTVVVFAGDHGIARDGVSAYPQEVTFQMVMNYLAGGAGINVFARQNGLSVKIVDAGVNFDFEDHPDLIQAKIAKGTQSYLKEPAMSATQCEQALAKGAEIIENLAKDGCNVVGFGEMGIGNTSSASLLMSILCQIPLDDCVGRGAGVDDAGLERKKSILNQALKAQATDGTPLSVLQTFGGFEIAMMCGAFLKAAEKQMVVLVDGFITTAALLVASQMHPRVLDYCLFSHVSDESGHRRMLDYLKATPLLNMSLRLGEGSGIALAYPLVAASVNFLNEMASFESAGVSEKDD